MAAAQIQFDSVWKKFERGERHDSLRDLIPAVVKQLFAPGAPEKLEQNEFWALRDVSFDVGPGEALGIIGTNGAGKSTALKLLTRILRPTLGSSSVRGRVGALIEVAAGFHPDLTGRENIYLQGTIMGMKHAEITAKLDDIIDFAGVSEFIDTPVKRYSSGMHARLGFSIASHMDPDVLIIDEVLAVGDIAFQQRCEERMMRFIKEGVAVAFVSHNLQAVARLCTSAILLDHGRVAASGTPDEVIRAYVSSTNRNEAVHDGPITITKSEVIADRVNGQSITVRAGGLITVRVSFEMKSDCPHLAFAFTVRRPTDQFTVFRVAVPAAELGIAELAAGDTATIEVDLSAHLTAGQYMIDFRIINIPARTIEAELFPMAFVTVEDEQQYQGIANLKPTFRIVRAAAPLQIGVAQPR